MCCRFVCFSCDQIGSGDRCGAVRGSHSRLRAAGWHGPVVPAVQEQRPRSQHVQHGQLGYVSHQNTISYLLLKYGSHNNIMILLLTRNHNNTYMCVHEGVRA